MELEAIELVRALKEQHTIVKAAERNLYQQAKLVQEPLEALIQAAWADAFPTVAMDLSVLTTAGLFDPKYKPTVVITTEGYKTRAVTREALYAFRTALLERFAKQIEVTMYFRERGGANDRQRRY